MLSLPLLFANVNNGAVVFFDQTTSRNEKNGRIRRHKMCISDATSKFYQFLFQIVLAIGHFSGRELCHKESFHVVMTEIDVDLHVEVERDTLLST